MSKHTKGKWILQSNSFKGENGLRGFAAVEEQEGAPIFYALSNTMIGMKEAQANAEIICTAVNDYDKLRTIAEETYRHLAALDYSDLSEQQRGIHARLVAYFGEQYLNSTK